MKHWAYDSVFYHIYPLGFCGAPVRNNFAAPATPRLEKLRNWLDHVHNLGINALYLGPVFESTAHGYDTADYFHVDRRLGHNETLAQLVAALHHHGIRVILDGVFHHVGRDFWAFRDVLAHGPQSAYCDWFYELSFERRSPFNDPFAYAGWNGHYDLVKLNLQHPAVKRHLFEAVEMWIRSFDIDGLRLDAADCIDKDFLRELASFCRAIRPDFWLLGEAVHGDYRTWANESMLDAVTNYECYKGLYSSHVDRNYFEIAYSLNRQFGPAGMYCHLPLYNFADNHDVSRVASSLSNPAHLYPLYCLLFTMPGVPSIYYGSEWGLTGCKHNGSDQPLRPCLNLETMAQIGPQPHLVDVIARLAQIRHNSPALKYGHYHQLTVNHEQFAFARQTGSEWVIVLVNAADEPASFTVPVPAAAGGRSYLDDLLNPGETFPIEDGYARVDVVWPHWARILAVR